MVKSKRPPGQPARSVIVYRRKGRGSLIQAEVNANLSLLVGYEKKMAYYMFFNEVGTRFEPARPVIRPVFDAGVDEALEAAGYPWLRFRDLRPAFGIEASELGAPMHNIQSALGHSSVAVTERYYAKYDPRSAARQLLKVIEGGRQKKQETGTKTGTYGE